MLNLNLVYDDWDDSTNKPIPNGEKMFGYPDRFWDASNLMYHFIFNGLNSNVERFTLEKYRMSDVYNNPDKKYYYIINHARLELQRVFNYELLDIHRPEYDSKKMFQSTPFSDEVLECVRKCKNFNIMFLTEHEPEDEIGFKTVIDYFKSVNVNEEQIFIINNNSELNELKLKYKSKINTYSLEFIPFSSTLSFEVIGSQYIKEKIGKFFMCHNKGPKIHRFLLLSLLKKYNLLDEINWSLVPTWKPYFDVHHCDTLITKNQYEAFKDDLDFFIDLKIKNSDFEGEKNWFKPFEDVQVENLPKGALIPEDRYTLENSYVNVITESQYINVHRETEHIRKENQVIHITEKSIRPFYFHQIPLILSTPGHIRKMKEKYKLDFFDDIINHNYDNEYEPEKRLFLFFNQILEINRNKENIIKFYENNQERFEENKRKILKILDDRKDYFYFKSLLN